MSSQRRWDPQRGQWLVRNHNGQWVTDRNQEGPPTHSVQFDRTIISQFYNRSAAVPATPMYSQPLPGQVPRAPVLPNTATNFADRVDPNSGAPSRSFFPQPQSRSDVQSNVSGGSRGSNRPNPQGLDRSESNGDTNASSFKQRDRRFFVPGRVLEVLWCEPLGSTTITKDNINVVIGQHGGRIYQKYRRFVIFRLDRLSCSAVAIFTYQGRGLGAPEADASSHSVIYTGRIEPQLEQSERGRGTPLLPIRVNADGPQGNLRPMSRLNYGKVYNIEYNVDIRNIGKVHDDYLGTFLNQVRQILYPPLHDPKNRGLLEHGAAQDPRQPDNRSGGRPPPPDSGYRPDGRPSTSSPSYTVAPTQGSRATGNAAARQPPRSLDPAVQELAQRLLAARPWATWDQAVDLAQRTLRP